MCFIKCGMSISFKSREVVKMQQNYKNVFFVYFFFVLIRLEAANTDAKTKAMKRSQLLIEFFNKQ